MTDPKQVARDTRNDQPTKAIVDENGNSASETVSEIEKCRLPQNFVAEAGVTEQTDVIQVRSPARTWWFRTRTGTEWRYPGFVLKDGGDNYLVSQAVSAVLDGAAKPRLMVPCVTREGTVFVWPVSMPDGDGRSNFWSESGMSAVLRASAGWVRVSADMKAGLYRVYLAADGPLIHVEPRWPELSLVEIIRIAFRDHVITDVEHPIVQRFLGKV